MIDGHGDDTYKYGELKANFSSNVYGATSHDGLWEWLSQHRSVIANYPEPQPRVLEAELATRWQIAPEEVCVTNGATEAIYLLAQLYRGRKSAVLQPTFTEYADACRLHGHRVQAFYRPEQLPAAEVVWICNPNNPTGETYDKTLLCRLFATHPKTMFIIDQSYEDFTLKPVLTPVEACAYDNVYLIHSMTKGYAIPGLRLGYITASHERVEELRTIRMPWSVNALAIEAGRYLLQNGKTPVLENLLEEKQRLVEELKGLGYVEVWDSDTHFFLCRLRQGTATHLKNYLAMTHGLLIRDASNFEGLDATFFRIATQDRVANDLLINALKQWK